MRRRGSWCGDSQRRKEVPVMRTLTILTFTAIIGVPTFAAAQSMTAQQNHEEKRPLRLPRG
jgi:hypothetical protein